MPNTTRAVLEKRVPIRARAGIGPTTPVTKLMTAADDAVVWVMLFSSALYGVRERQNTAKIPNPSRAAVMLPPSMIDTLRHV